MLLSSPRRGCARRARRCSRRSRTWPPAATRPTPACALGEAIADWSEYGGYELEGQWDAACRRIVRAGFDDVGARRTTELSGGERKRLVLDVLFSGDAQVLLLDEPDNFLDVPAKLDLEAPDRGLQEDGPAGLPRPRPARRGGHRDPHAGGQRLLDARRLLHDLPRGAGPPPGAARRPPGAVEARGAPPVPLLQDHEAARRGERRQRQARGRGRDALAPLRRRRPAAAAR